MSIAARIKEARKRMSLTQEELANIIGVTKGAIANYENGVSTPKLDIMFSLMRALEIDANYLFDYVPVGALKLSDHELNLIIAYRSHPEMQAAVNTLLGLPAANVKLNNA